MAQLISEDQDCISKITLLGRDKKILTSERAPDQEWQKIDLKLTSGKLDLFTQPTEDVMLCRSPHDEIVTLVEGLEQLLEKKRDEVLFEPSEPSFEMSFARTRRGGIKVEAWIDAGNATTGIYTWDASGIRFYSTDANIRSFTEEIRREFRL
jgi:hypothetical protein